MRTQVSIGIVGSGESARRFAETFDDHPECELRWLCHPQRTPVWGARFPRAEHGSFDELLDDDDLDAIVLTGAIEARSDAARAAILAGKHVFLGGPAATTAGETFALAALAREHGRCLVGGHGLYFDHALRKLKEGVDTGQIGEVLHVSVSSRRLGQGDGEADVLWALGPREVATVLYLLDDAPIAAAAWGESYLRSGESDILYGFLRFATGITVHLQLSRLDPSASRKLTLVGTRAMAVYAPADVHPLTMYDHTIDPPNLGTTADARIREGGARLPFVPRDDGLAVEAHTFVSAVRRGRPVESDARSSTNVAATLEALQASADLGGAPVAIAPPTPNLHNVVALATRST